MKKLENKTALITGGGTGIGRAMALAFAGEGAKIAICGRRREPIDATVAELKALGAEALGMSVDQAIEADCIRAIEETAGTLGGLDILVNNAASVGQVGPVADLEVSAWEDALRVNLTGLMVLCREAVKVMIPQQRGNILNVSSNVGRRGFANRAPYVCSKWAMHGFTQTLALETAQVGIRVNTICPGPVMTDRLRGSMEKMSAKRGISPAELQQEWEGESPMGRFATSEECAKVALFLVSDDSSAMTGQAINVTAGMLMS
jgi:NAD(P)-dependent dehydrogenase (short-subunit alcohol dehydrogenase family)